MGLFMVENATLLSVERQKVWNIRSLAIFRIDQLLAHHHQTGPEEEAHGPAGSAEHGAGDDHQHVMQEISQTLGRKNREEIGYDQDGSGQKRCQGQIPNQRDGGPVLGCVSLPEDQAAHAEEPEGKEIAQNPHCGSRLTDKAEAGADTEKHTPKDEK